jgi:hypothetical protein
MQFMWRFSGFVSDRHNIRGGLEAYFLYLSGELMSMLCFACMNDVGESGRIVDTLLEYLKQENCDVRVDYVAIILEIVRDCAISLCTASRLLPCII